MPVIDIRGSDLTLPAGEWLMVEMLIHASVQSGADLVQSQLCPL